MLMKRNIIITSITAFLFLLTFAITHLCFHNYLSKEYTVKIGFVHEGDESIPYTNNFIRAQHTIAERFGNKVNIIAKNNVTPDELDKTLDELVKENCKIIFTTSYSHAIIAKEFAEKYPEIQFCQAMGDNAGETPVLKNYHTFMGEIHKGFYVAGIVAGLKLNELVDKSIITTKEARLGFVATYPYAGSISSYTAFLLGAISVCPEAKMNVRYTYSWSHFSEEKNCAKDLIDDGCIIIAQCTDTTGPAIACEENSSKNVFHIGYNQSMIDIAPKTSLTSTRINWSPFITGAVQAVLKNKSIENTVKGRSRGTDTGAGFDLNWVQLLALNTDIIPAGTEKAVEKTIHNFKKGKQSVFLGNYIGVNPYNDEDTYNLANEYKENATSSFPTFYYVIRELISIDEQSLF